MHQNPDIQYFQNNGVLAVRPGKTGRLSHLVRQTRKGDERVWVFADSCLYKDDDGDEHIDHRERGVVCGTYNEGQQFLAMCRELGFTVQSVGFFVPFSNGQRRHAPDPRGGPDMCDWPEDELKLMRWDLPSRTDLELAIAA